MRGEESVQDSSRKGRGGDHLGGLAVNWRIIIGFNWLRIWFSGRFL
jgi:hypothetical protein